MMELLFVCLGLVCSRTGLLLERYILDRYVYSAGDFGCDQRLFFGETAYFSLTKCSFM